MAFLGWLAGYGRVAVLLAMETADSEGSTRFSRSECRGGLAGTARPRIYTYVQLEVKW
jgi:hypothetical protein